MRIPRRVYSYSLLSYNVLCGSLLDPLPISRFRVQAQKIKLLRPDVVCLQEFNNRYIEKIYRQELASDYHFVVQSVDILEMGRRLVLCMSLLGFTYVLHPLFSILCVLTTLNPYIHNFMTGSQKTGNAILVHKDHPVTTSKITEFELQGGDMLNWMRRRGFVDTSFYGLRIRNTHLNHGKDDKRCARTLQMSECLGDVCGPVLLVGDFNTENTEMIAKKGFCDLMAPLGCTYRCDNPLTHEIAHDKRIDYIFSKDVHVTDTAKLDFDSDHDALYIRFELEKEEENTGA